jgi:hypothetical protein
MEYWAWYLYPQDFLIKFLGAAHRNMKALHLPIIILYCSRKRIFSSTFRGQSFSIARENSCFLTHFAANHFVLLAKTPIF